MVDARGSKRAILRAYNWFAPFYGVWSALLEQKATARGLALSDVQSGDRVLDVAAGEGSVLAQLCKRVAPGGIAAGVDLAPRMLAAARRRAPVSLLVRADAGALPFAAGCFDLVWSSYFLDLIPNAELPRLLREFWRVLRPGGRMVLVSLSNKPGERGWWERLYERTPSRLVPYIFGGCRPIETEAFVREAGFIEIVRELVSQGLDSEVILARKPS